MEKIVLVLLVVFLNVALYVIFVLDDRFRIGRNVKIAYVAFAVVAYAAWTLSGLPFHEILRISILLMVLYFMSYFLGRVMLRMRRTIQNNERIIALIRRIILFGVAPVYTALATAVQVFLLYKGQE